MSIFKGKTFIFRGWAQSYRLWAAILTVSEGMFCSAAGIWDTPLLIIMKSKRHKLTFGREAASFWQSSLSSLKVFQTLKSSSREESSWRWNICRGWKFMMQWAFYCGDPFLNDSFQVVISLLFPDHKNPPYGTFGKGHYSASQQAGISGEPGHLKCADSSLCGTVRGNGRSGLVGIVYAWEMSSILFLL